MPKVCLIDDDIFVRDALSLGLSDAGYEVVVAPGAAAGLDIIAHGGIDAVITDINMPDVKGNAVIAEARQRWPSIALIAITGASMSDGRPTGDVARELGADACLIKPFRAAQLAAAVHQALAARAGG